MRKKLTEKEWKKAMENVMHYRAAMAVFTIWLDRGYIIPEEFRRIDDKTAEKYKIHRYSIYRDYKSIADSSNKNCSMPM